MSGTGDLTSSLSCNLALSTRGKSDQHDLRMFEPILLHQRVKCSGILWRQSYASMRCGFTEPPYLIGAMNCMPLLSEKDRVGHRSVVPLLAVPNLVH